MKNIIIDKPNGSYKYQITEENGVYREVSTLADGSVRSTVISGPTTIKRGGGEVAVIYNARGIAVDIPAA